MEPLTELQGALNNVVCPQCQKSRLDLSLRCELGPGECLYMATCLHCGYAFEVSTETRDLRKTNPDLENHLSGTRCPYCEKVGAHLRFRCDLRKRACLYVAACNHCGEISHQYR